MTQSAMPKAATISSDFLTVHEVATLFRVDDTTVRRWIKQGALDAIELPGKQNKKYRVRRDTVNKYL